jgi:excinuclease ABC subunit A
MTDQRNAECNRADEHIDPYVSVQGARTHNLKDVSFRFPRNAMVVFTGVSGSGKSSLAFDTLYAEAQRRFIESVSPHARRLIDQAAAPDVDNIDGLPPAVALQQSRAGAQERSTVGSLTRISVTLRLLFSRAGARPDGVPFMTADYFSPNNPEGACPHCQGLGSVHTVKTDSMVPDDSLSIRQGAIASWPRGWHNKNLRSILETLGYDVDAPWHTLSSRDQQWILLTDEQPSVPIFIGLNAEQREEALAAGEEPAYTGTYTSAAKIVLQSYSGGSETTKKRLARYVTVTPCSACHGKRLNRDALSVTFAGYDIASLSELSVSALAELLKPYADGTSSNLPVEAALREAVIRMTSDISMRLQQLDTLGLGHLAPGRRTTQLSSGELQRVRLATQLISRLFGVLYVLDEPSAGLHPDDVKALLTSLKNLVRAGNSLVVVEHNMDLIAEADWLIEVGPGPGTHGGEIVYNGEPAGLKNIASPTSDYLFSRSYTGLRQRRPAESWLRFEQVHCNNISAMDIAIPLARMTAVTGVSGSGKSTLLNRVLPEMLGRFDKIADSDEGEEEDLVADVRGQVVSGSDAIGRLVRIDQRPIGRTPRSNLATYTGFFDIIRRLFAETPAAKAKGFSASRFSFNLPAGRCPACEGQGQISIELLFMPSATATCSVCAGGRYNPDTLEVKWNNLTIADVLALTVDDATALFHAYDGIQRSLKALTSLGLGYLTLGQPATELSGGECQRIKLAWELQRLQRTPTLYLLDEPSSGLHPSDMDKLLIVLDELVKRGHTVIMAEHTMRIVAEADWVIDLGPGSGLRGGKIVSSGLPEEVSLSAESLTAPWLSAQLKKRAGDPD